MTPQQFVRDMEMDLAIRGVRYDQAALLAFINGAWPLIEDDHDVTHWAREFVAGLAATRLQATSAPDAS